jgi:hypothetical protein
VTPQSSTNLVFFCLVAIFCVGRSTSVLLYESTSVERIATARRYSSQQFVSGDRARLVVVVVVVAVVVEWQQLVKAFVYARMEDQNCQPNMAFVLFSSRCVLDESLWCRNVALSRSSSLSISLSLSRRASVERTLWVAAARAACQRPIESPVCNYCRQVCVI